jgi:hypothetical protein
VHNVEWQEDREIAEKDIEGNYRGMFQDIVSDFYGEAEEALE